MSVGCTIHPVTIRVIAASRQNAATIAEIAKKKSANHELWLSMSRGQPFKYRGIAEVLRQLFTEGAEVNVLKAAKTVFMDAANIHTNSFLNIRKYADFPLVKSTCSEPTQIRNLNLKKGYQQLPVLRWCSTISVSIPEHFFLNFKIPGFICIGKILKSRGTKPNLSQLLPSEEKDASWLS